MALHEYCDWYDDSYKEKFSNHQNHILLCNGAGYYDYDKGFCICYDGTISFTNNC